MENKELWIRACKASVLIQQEQDQTPPPESPSLPTSGQAEAWLASPFSLFPSLLVKDQVCQPEICLCASIFHLFWEIWGRAPKRGLLAFLAGHIQLMSTHNSLSEEKKEEWRYLIVENLTMTKRNHSIVQEVCTCRMGQCGRTDHHVNSRRQGSLLLTTVPLNLSLFRALWLTLYEHWGRSDGLLHPALTSEKDGKRKVWKPKIDCVL